MQPELSPTPRSQEQGPVNQGDTYEVPPNFASPEVLPSTSLERGEQRSPIELAPQPPQQPAPVLPPLTPAPLPTVPPLPGVTPVTNPVTANDDDTIEKEWVDRAKQVIIQTKDDAYARERALGELQRDYLMKRYGKQLGSNNE